MTKIISVNRWQHLAGILKEQVENDSKGPWYVEQHHMMYGDQVVADGFSSEEEAEKIANKWQNKDKEGWSNYVVKNAEEDNIKMDEAQFATDPMKNIDTSWQSVGKDPDYEQVYAGELEQEPTMIGSSQDEEFSLDDFDTSEEGLTVREPDWDVDPEYAGDELGDLYGLSWDDAEAQHEKDMYQHGRPVIRDTDIGRKS